MPDGSLAQRVDKRARVGAHGEVYAASEFAELADFGLVNVHHSNSTPSDEMSREASGFSIQSGTNGYSQISVLHRKVSCTRTMGSETSAHQWIIVV